MRSGLGEARPSKGSQAHFTPRCWSGVTFSRLTGLTKGTAQMTAALGNALVDGQCLERAGAPHFLLGLTALPLGRGPGCCASKSCSGA